jgi:DNA/RNA endonuclease G (NUC1)
MWGTPVLAQCNALYQAGAAPAVTGAGPLGAIYAGANRYTNCISEMGVLAPIPYFSVMYNTRLKSAEWVVYRLDNTRIPVINARHSNQAKMYYTTCCLPDPAVSPILQASHFNFTGYDEGHMAPRLSMEQSLVALASANLYTNISPQTGPLNRGPWKALETAIRTWATPASAVYVIVGPLYNNAAAPTYTTPGPAQLRVAKPDFFFAVVYRPDQPANSRRQFYIFPNTNAVAGPITAFQLANVGAFNAAIPDANYTINLNLGPP